jgi:hypothetical protein
MADSTTIRTEPNGTVRYACPACFNTYGTLHALDKHRRNVHGWRREGGTPGMEQRIAELEEQVRYLTEQVERLKGG